MVMQVVERVLATIGWSLLGVILLYLCVRLFDRLDPIDYRNEVLKGNVAAGIIVSALIAAMAAIIISVIVT